MPAGPRIESVHVPRENPRVTAPAVSTMQIAVAPAWFVALHPALGRESDLPAEIH